MGRQHQYSGVPAASATAHDDDDVVPVAMAVSAAGGSIHDDDTASSLPTASKVEGASTNQQKNKADGHDDNDGVTIQWEKGEVQPPAFRDKWFAIIFVVHLLAVFGTAFALGPAAWSKLTSAGTGDEHQDDDDQKQAGMDDDNSQNYSGDVPPEGFWITIIVIALLAAPTLSIATLGFMSKNAEGLIRASLWFSVVLCGLAAVVFLVAAPPAGIFYAILTACLVCYARTVQHKIPYAACNLRCGITAVKSNLGVGFVALGSMVVLIVFTLAWTVAFAGTMDLDEMKADPADSNFNGGGDMDGDQTDLSGLGACVAMMFILSLYWTHQVLKNVVRTSVAGVVGTWWFTPLEASSFCSMAVRDSFLRSTTYSLGSIAFGSLIVAILQLLRNMLRNAANDNRNGGGILRCIAACILLYLQRIMEYFNKWAYVYVGLYGYDYITAGKKVMGLFKTRGWSAVIADNLVNRLLGIVSLTIGLLVGVCTLLVAFLVEEFESKGGWLGAGFVVGFIIGLVLSGVVMGLLSSAVDSVIVCYAEAPNEFSESHPDLSTEMQQTWSAAWPNLNLTGPVVISLGGGIGLV